LAWPFDLQAIGRKLSWLCAGSRKLAGVSSLRWRGSWTKGSGLAKKMKKKTILVPLITRRARDLLPWERVGRVVWAVVVGAEPEARAGLNPGAVTRAQALHRCEAQDQEGHCRRQTTHLSLALIAIEVAMKASMVVTKMKKMKKMKRALAPSATLRTTTRVPRPIHRWAARVLVMTQSWPRAQRRRRKRRRRSFLHRLRQRSWSGRWPRAAERSAFRDQARGGDRRS